MTPTPLFFNAYGTHPETLAILHGFLGSSGNWHTLARSVFAEHYRVLTLDARNHGRSFHSDAFSYAEMAEDLATVLHAEHLTHAALLGHSMGGKTAMQFALRYPERTRALVVVDMAPRAYPPHHTSILDALNAVDLSRATSRADVDALLTPHITDWGVRQFLLKNLVVSNDGGVRWAINLPVLTARYEAVTEAVQGDTPFTGPTLFIRGGRSAYIRDEDRADIERLFPAAEIATIPEAGHWVHADAPQRLAQLVLDFLAEAQ